MRDREKAKKQTAVTSVLRMNVADARVWRGEQLLKLTPKAFTVLHSLSEHAGRLVTKDELMQTVWADTVVTDGTLAASIRELRKALQDDAQSPQYIETVHRRRYRFIGKVISNQSVGMPVPSSLPRSQPIPDPRPPIPPLVGRESELAQLHRQLDKALNGERQLIFVTGEPGIGKTTLVDAFLAESRDWRLEAGSASPQVSSLKSQAPSFWLGQGQCIEHYGAGEAYLPVLEALGRLCRGVDGERLIALFNQHAPTWLVQMPALLNTTEHEALQRKTQGATRDRMLRELTEALEVITAEHLLIFVLEDLHWSDPSTLDLLSLVARRTEPARLLIICTYRPVEVIASEHPLKTVKHELQFHNYCQELALELLSEAAIAEYLMGRFGIPPPSQGESQGEGDFPISWQRLAHLIHQCTEGNPLFLVAMVEDLIAREVFVQTALGWKLKEEAPIVASRIPDSIRQLVILQSGRLSSEARHLLEAASIAGLEFSAASVAAALGTETADIERQCEQLAERQHFL